MVVLVLEELEAMLDEGMEEEEVVVVVMVADVELAA